MALLGILDLVEKQGFWTEISWLGSPSIQIKKKMVVNILTFWGGSNAYLYDWKFMARWWDHSHLEFLVLQEIIQETKKEVSRPDLGFCTSTMKIKILLAPRCQKSLNFNIPGWNIYQYWLKYNIIWFWGCFLGWKSWKSPGKKGKKES